MFFGNVLKTGEMLNMLNMLNPRGEMGPSTPKKFNIFNISPVLGILGKKYLTFPLFREGRLTKQGKC